MRIYNLFSVFTHVVTLETTAGCSNSCSHHGSCIMQDGLYTCKCSNGWAGDDCSIRLETNCSDDIDNDEGKIGLLNLFLYRIFEPD